VFFGIFRPLWVDWFLVILRFHCLAGADRLTTCLPTCLACSFLLVPLHPARILWRCFERWDTRGLCLLFHLRSSWARGIENPDTIDYLIFPFRIGPCVTIFCRHVEACHFKSRPLQWINCFWRSSWRSAFIVGCVFQSLTFVALMIAGRLRLFIACLASNAQVV